MPWCCSKCLYSSQPQSPILFTSYQDIINKILLVLPMLFDLPWLSGHLLKNSNTQLKTRSLARNQGFAHHRKSTVISVTKIEGSQHRPKVVFCAFMQAQFAAVTSALAKGSRASLGAPFTQLCPTTKATSMPEEA